MTILFDFTLLENDLSFFIVKQNRHAPAKWHRKRIRKEGAYRLLLAEMCAAPRCEAAHPAFLVK